MHEFQVSLHSKPLHRVHVCSAVTCHLHFWQSDRGHLRAAAVTGRWKIYRNESAQKADPVKKILPPLRRRLKLELATFRSWVRHSNHWAISAPQTVWVQSKFTSYMTVSHIDWNGHQNEYRNMTVSHLDWNGYRNGYRNMTVSHIDWNGYQNGYWNTSQHWKLTLEKKILPSLLPGLKPVTFRSHVRRRRSTTELSPLSVLLWSCRPFLASQN